MIKKLLLVVALVALVAGASGGYYWYSENDWKFDDKLEVSGTLSRHYSVWSAEWEEPLPDTWVFITVPVSNEPCASTLTDENGMYAFKLEIGSECDFSGGVEVVEGLWTVFACVSFECEFQSVELADDLQPILDMVL